MIDKSIPDFICAGAARSGTTALWKWFREQPEIHVPPIKETNYFAHDLIRRNGPGDKESIRTIESPDAVRDQPLHAGIVKDESVYAALMQSESSAICGEVSPAYMFYACTVAPRILEMSPECKIIIILREPVSRAFSNYALFRRLGREKESLKNALELESTRLNAGWEHAWAYKSLGLYADAVDVFFNAFGRDHVWVGLYDELSRNPNKFLKKLASFLGIEIQTMTPLMRANESDYSLGPITSITRFLNIGQAKSFLPQKVRRILRIMDSSSANKMYLNDDPVIVKSLKNFYFEDVKRLDKMIPDLSIAKHWAYY